jgi:hypothetical protein
VSFSRRERDDKKQTGEEGRVNLTETAARQHRRRSVNLGVSLLSASGTELFSSISTEQ